MLVTAFPPSTSEAVSWSGICQRLLGAQDECFKREFFMCTFMCPASFVAALLQPLLSFSTLQRCASWLECAHRSHGAQTFL